ncbi:MAG: HAD family phosphatase [Alphaproteobacteria bacterium]|nr:HAD family phosphatase [Alphaproteobacteria bacterium]MBV8406155.1 HAD family phosphatase [Alphaproteobacteria bacterium]
MVGKVPESSLAKDPETAWKSPPSVVVFDMGGVLIDWNPRHLYRKLIDDPQAMERFLDTVTTTAWHMRQDAGGDPAEATRRLQAEHPEHAALIEAFYDRFDEMLDHSFPAMVGLVERLHAAGTPLYLLSNAPAFLDGWARGRGRRRHPFLGCFRDVVVSGLVGCCKPDAAIYRLVCQAGAFQPHEAVLIDDNLPNVEGARGFGMHAVHHVSAERTTTALRELGLPV